MIQSRTVLQNLVLASDNPILMLIYWQMYGSGACEAAMTQQIYGESSHDPLNVRCFQSNNEWEN